MSLRFLSTHNSPPLVATAGVAIVLGIPALNWTSASLAALKVSNVASFLVNVVAVSVPGRLDGQEQQGATKRVANESVNEPAPKQEKDDSSNPYFSNRTRTLVNPSGYAFSIWLPIYLGEAIFVVSQFMLDSSSLLSQLTPPFVAANLTQSLWCAAFRPSYNTGWKKFISAGLLAATAYSLNQVHDVTCSMNVDSWSYTLIPLTMHYGWMCAATLVNFNGSLAMSESVSDKMLSMVGHVSILVATTLGVTITLARNSPTFGFTLAWALAACAKGMTQRLQDKSSRICKSVDLQKGARLQRILCWVGAGVCMGASAVTMVK